MDPLSVTASVIAILQLSNKVLGYLNDVNDASKERAECAIEASNLYSLLLSLRFRLEEGSADKLWYTAVRALAVENGPLDQFKQSLELLQTRMTEGGRLKKACEALVWKFKKGEIASTLGRMERLKTLIEIALQMDHFKLSHAIKDDTVFIRTHIPTIQSGLDTIRQDQDHAKRDELIAWISPMDFPAQQSDIIGRRQEGTGQWFLDDPAFAKWLSQPKETLFCPGIPGAGKTMIAAIVIDHLLKAVQSSAVGVAYVYCNYKAQGEQDAASLLAAILKQLVQTRPSIVEPVERLRKKYANLGTNKPSADETFGALQSVIAEFSTTYVVVDALDESPNGDGTRHRFLGQLRALQAKSDVRLVFTSRFIPDIVDEFREAPTLEVRAHEEDVRRFVAGQIYRLPKCIQRDAALRDMVQEKVTRAVDGMQVLPVARCSSTSSPSLRFLLARLYLDSLLDKRTKHKVQSRLETLSKGSKALEKAYEDAIKRIKGQLPEDAALASTVLSWIIYAQRALTIAEIRHALAVEPDQDDLNLDNLPDVEDIVSVCAGLVAIDEESNIIRLVHYTTQEYFEHIRDQWNPNAQLEITSTCLTYLSFAAFESGSCSTDEEFESRLEQSVFLDYAARYWGIHATTVQDEVYELARSFLLHSGLISCAVQVMSAPDYKHRGYSQTYPENTTGLHITAQFGLHRLSEILLHEFGGETTFSVCAEDSRGQTPLVLAAKRGHEPMVKLLLDNGSDANAELYCGSALQAASYEGQEQIVKLLLDNGADANAQGGPYRNALLAASCSGHEQIIKLLLNNGADVNAPGEPYSRALQIASSRGHEQIVKLLLNNGADVNANVPSRGRTKWIGSFT